MKKKVLIVGGGFAGCAAARMLSDIKNLEITLVEKNSFLGAGVRTFFYGGHPYTFGPRHFLTKNKKVYNYLNSIVPLRNCNFHEFLTYVEGDQNFYNFPLNYKDIDKMPDSKEVKKELSKKNFNKILKAKNLEDYWISSVGKRIYEKTIKKYNHKMWLVKDNKKIDTFNWSAKGATIQKGPRAAFYNVISAYPKSKEGYNGFFDDLLKVKKIKFFFNSSLRVKNLNQKKFIINGKIKSFDIVISSISPDFYLNYKFGELKFIGRDFHKIVLPVKNAFPKKVFFLYYANDEKFTRLVEYKKFTKHKSNSTLIGMEIPSLNGKHYPLPFKSEILKANKYFNKLPKWFFSVGRAGTYRYLVDIDDCIEQAMEIKNIILSNNYDGPIPLKKWIT